MKDVSNPVTQQNNLSVGLIILNIILGLVFINCTPQREDDFFISLLFFGMLLVLLQALFVFTYKGKAPLISKWVLAVFIVITILYGVFIGYLMALGQAFQH